MGESPDGVSPHHHTSKRITSIAAETQPITAIILAGGKAKPDFTAATGVTNRALVTLAPDGRTMLDLVVAALLNAERVGRIFVVGDVPQPDTSGVKPLVVLPPGNSLIDNIFIGFDAAHAAPDERVLLVSADIPFISGAAVDDYVTPRGRAGRNFATRSCRWTTTGASSGQ